MVQVSEIIIPYRCLPHYFPMLSDTCPAGFIHLAESAPVPAGITNLQTIHLLCVFGVAIFLIIIHQILMPLEPGAKLRHYWLGLITLLKSIFMETAIMQWLRRLPVFLWNRREPTSSKFSGRVISE